MAEDGSREHEEEAKMRRAARETAAPRGEWAEQAAPDLPAAAPTLLADSRLRGRGNAPLRTEMLRQLQQTQGNRAAQRAVQRAVETAAPGTDDDLGARIAAASGGGRHLDAPIQAQLERGLDTDLSNVRVHTDGEAEHLARSVDAVAFTTGQDVFFRSGMYNPASPAGLHLLAHEAVHTVQQTAGPVAGTPAPGGVAISDPADAFERAASQAADRVVAGTPAPGTRSRSATIQRQIAEEAADATAGELAQEGEPTIGSAVAAGPSSDDGPVPPSEQRPHIARMAVQRATVLAAGGVGHEEDETAFTTDATGAVHDAAGNVVTLRAPDGVYVEQDSSAGGANQSIDPNTSSQQNQSSGPVQDASPNASFQPPDTNASSRPQGPNASSASFDTSLDLSIQAPIQVAPDDLPSKLGDYPTPGDSPMPANPPSLQAMRAKDAPVQRDDDPHPSADAQTQGTVGQGQPAPWSLQVTGVYRNLNLAQIRSLHLDLGHEPNVSLQIDSKLGISAQAAVGLVNSHWMPPWNRELEVGLSGLVNVNLLPQVAASVGGQVQAEQHIVPWFSITLSTSGMWSPPQGGNPGQFAVTGSVGALVHFDGF